MFRLAKKRGGLAKIRRLWRNGEKRRRKKAYHCMFRVIQTCKNMLKHSPPLDTNVNFVAHLLQGVLLDSFSLQDFTSVLDTLMILIRFCQLGVLLSSAAITIALGPLYPDPLCRSEPFGRMSTLRNCLLKAVLPTYRNGPTLQVRIQRDA
jgi:hypothetical protein